MGINDALNKNQFKTSILLGTNRKMNNLINIILLAINYIINQVNYDKQFIITVIDF